MITIEFPDLNLYKYFPEEIAECNEKEYIKIARFAYAYYAKEINYQQFQQLTVYAILDIKKRKRKLSEEVETEVYQKMNALLFPIVDNYFEASEDGLTFKLKTDFITPKIESFKFLFKKFYGVKNPLTDINFGQWIDGVELILNHFNHPKEDTYAKLLAIFFKLKGEEYDPTKTEKRAKHFQHIDIGIRYGFFLYLVSFMNYLNTASVDIGGKNIDLSIIFQETEKYKSPREGIGLRATAYTMAETGEFGDYNQLRKTALGDIKLRLYEMKKQYLDEMDKQKSKS